MDPTALLQAQIFGNTLQSYFLAGLLFLGGTIFLRILERWVVGRVRAFFEKHALKIDTFLFEVFQKHVIPLLYLGAFYFAAEQLVLNQAVSKLVNAFCIVVLTIQSVRLVLALFIYLLEKTWFRKEVAVGGNPISRSILNVIRIVIWGLGIVFILDNMGFNVSAVIAGLGIGGIAVALAAQTILGDLFNYFVIFFDRPFQEGDFIVVGDYSGNVEHIGIKTTRIRSVDGDQLVISNTDLTGSRIRNYKRMEKRTVRFVLGVTYQTSLDQLKKIPGVIQGIIKNMKDVIFDRAHFKSFADSSLEFEVVYFVVGSDYLKYMDIQQTINLTIKELFDKEGIEFAYPTQTVYEYKMEATV